MRRQVDDEALGPGSKPADCLAKHVLCVRLLAEQPQLIDQRANRLLAADRVAVSSHDISVAPLSRCVIVRTWVCTWSSASSSSSCFTMSRAGLNALPATSIVGASAVNSADCLQFKISAVIITAAAMVLLLFFFGIRTNHSVISRRPVSASYAPKIDAARSNTHGAHASPIVGEPGASTIFSSRNTASARSASSGKIGGGMMLRPDFSRSAQSTHAVEVASVIAASKPSRPLTNCLLPTSGEGS